MNEMTKEYFFCYTKSMSIYLKENGIDYLFKAISIKNKKIFTLYKKSPELQRALDSYEKQ
ncbi:DUF5659 domain-containing protein [Psychrobacillus sp. PGGUH221]|uniref:DUF5659 domain-containing protein n=1 Tax=Psychrobacillus sp. PGGUH221 TaxID=3020058 RepID=UPI0035C6FCDA